MGRSHADSSYIIHNPNGIRLIMRLCLGLSHLNEHKFWNDEIFVGLLLLLLLLMLLLFSLILFFLKYLFYLFSQYSRILVLEERKNKDMFYCDVVCAISFNFIIVVNFVKLVKMCTYTYIEKNVLYLIYCGHFPLDNVVRAFWRK